MRFFLHFADTVWKLNEYSSTVPLNCPACGRDISMETSGADPGQNPPINYTECDLAVWTTVWDDWCEGGGLIVLPYMTRGGDSFLDNYGVSRAKGGDSFLDNYGVSRVKGGDSFLDKIWSPGLAARAPPLP